MKATAETEMLSLLPVAAGTGESAGLLFWWGSAARKPPQGSRMTFEGDTCSVEGFWPAIPSNEPSGGARRGVEHHWVCQLNVLLLALAFASDPIDQRIAMKAPVTADLLRWNLAQLG